ncbi:histidine phosphatase family protein [Chamaesiphon sp. VAR_48_metabat_135_sub]|uniref:histidine phosphatase family protein n=1 Tax=Chamaesiphon sp. VAR_48_metabat_135_sub TaxID=2964699 RepID=UPI00286AF181|nr:histidine phosphatase family protein [Chamaesiphon sp. VAR_48_metabat_135_sub]
MSTRVIILRHGQSSYNSQGRIQGRSDLSVLTDRGQEDAKTTGKAFQGLEFAAVYCSPLQRAKQTATTVLSCLEQQYPLQTDDRLLEIDLPVWETMLNQEVREKYADEYRAWKERPHELKMLLPQADGSQQEFFPVLSLYAQATTFWQGILPQHQGQTILIVAHNGINRALISSALGIPARLYHSIQQSNCGITVLNFSGGWGDKVQLESLNQTSHLGQKLPTFRPNNQGPRFLLVRHGETDWNRAGKFQGQIDVPLNDNGRNQAILAAEFLKTIQIDFGFTSPMLRPKETAEIIIKDRQGLTLGEDADLREIGHGLWEGKFEAEIETEYPGELERWQTHPESVQMPEGENLQDVWDRATGAWQQILAKVGNQTQTGIIVAHDATNKVLLCYLLGLGLADIWKIKQGNGAVTVIDYPEGIEGQPVIQALNITSHLAGGILDKTAAGAL